MFGRRRRAARAAEQADLLAQSRNGSTGHTAAASSTRPLTHAQVAELLHSHLDGLIGAHGIWTLTRRTSDDTEVFFHDLAAREMAATLATALSAPVSMPQTVPAAADLGIGLLADSAAAARPSVPVATAVPAQTPLPTETAVPAVPAQAEPLALPWSPRPISRWADPSPESAAIPIPAQAAVVSPASSVDSIA